MEMDMTGLWSWTVPLWGLGALVFFLAAILMGPTEILTRMPGPPAPVAGGAASQGGGSRKSSRT
jgi:hypothetical protein